jgi:DNA transformation protein
VDDATRGRYETRGMGPFRPAGEDGEVMQYYEVPGDVLDDAELLAPWVQEAIAVAAKAKRGRSRR